MTAVTHEGANLVGRLLGCLAGVCIAAALVVGSAPAAHQILGGTPISISAAPWSALVTYDDGTNDYDCTGTIVDPFIVVTSTECLYTSSGTAVAPTSLSVTAGVSNVGSPGQGDQEQDRGVAFYHIDPGYVNNTTSVGEDDVADLTLTSPLTLSNGSDVAAAPLPAANSPYPTGASAVMAAYGATSPSDNNPNSQLESMTASVEPQGQCGSGNVYDDDAIYFCASSSTASACDGDSGAGLVTTGASPTLVGVDVGYVGTSSCTPGTEMLFVNVTSTEILQFIQGNSEPPTAPRNSGSGVTQITWPSTHLYVGETVTCSSTGWTQPSTLSYSFLGANGQQLQTGSKPTYTLTQSDLGQTISCEALATNAGGTDIIDAEPTPVVSATPANTAPAAGSTHSSSASAAATVAQYLSEISESKWKPRPIVCAALPDRLPAGTVFLGGGLLKSNTMILSKSYVCQPLATAPLLSHSGSAVSAATVDAVEVLTNDWFEAQGVTNMQRSVCDAVQYTWKFLKRSDLAPASLASARQDLLSSDLPLAERKVPISCLT